ncbi:filamentous hemagglutinin family protein [Bradyrhizobium sp. LB7.1]
MRRPSAKRDNDELTLRRLARFRSMSLLCAMQMVFLPVFSVRLQAQPANVITPDGRTGTSLQTSGSVTNVTTSTVSGNNAFNSFSQFSVGQGNTVNLQLPTGTQNLVNIVRDAPVYVNGTLNSYMNGAIGGNVYFADPKGFVVGRSGTVNVGSLSVSTPTREFTDSLIGAGGQINGSAVGNLMAGSFPVSPDGNIRIYGRINAQDGVRLTGQNIFVGGGASQRDIANLDHAAKFSASVNSKGLRSAAAITVRNGSIHIGAVNNATVNGRLTARSKSATPSNVTVVAGNKAELGKNARLSTASKTADAGGVLVKAGNDVTVKSGAKISASSKTGNAGLVELSGNGVIDVGSGVTINLAAPNGQAGTLLIDPTDVVIGDMSQGDVGVTLGNTSVANAIAALSAGGTYLVQADHSVTLAAHAVIDARNLDAAKTHSVGNAINVEIDAPTISIVNGAKILAQAINIGGTTYTSGSVTLTATANDTKLSGQATATTGITIDGQITGGDISIGATSTATSSFTSSVPGLFTLVGTTLAASLLGLNGGYVAASATAGGQHQWQRQHQRRRQRRHHVARLGNGAGSGAGEHLARRLADRRRRCRRQARRQRHHQRGLRRHDQRGRQPQHPRHQ